MPRPTKPRRIGYIPENKEFFPKNIQEENSYIELSLEEVEALRLADYEGLDQIECADFMRVSRGTLQRIIKEARGKVAEAICFGLPIKISGGNYTHEPQRKRCNHCHDNWQESNRNNCPSCGSDDIKSDLPRRRQRRQGRRFKNREER